MLFINLDHMARDIAQARRHLSDVSRGAAAGALHEKVQDRFEVVDLHKERQLRDGSWVDT